jgi:membrane AbrB-like protein
MPSVLSSVIAQTLVLLPATAIGGGFAAMGFPAAWLSGGLLASAAMACAGLGSPLGPRLRDLAMMMSGVTMGAAVTPETLRVLTAVPVSLVFLVAAMLAITAGSTIILTRLFGWNRSDALYASIPGAMSTILLIAHERKADIPSIATVQLFRIAMVIIVLPPILGAAAPHPPQVLARIFAPEAWVFLMAAAVAAAWVLQRIRMPGALLLGGMLGTATLTGSGSIDGRFPDVLASISFMLIGVFIGDRFRGIRAGGIVGLLPAAVVSFVAGTLIAAAFAEATSMVVGVSREAALLAFVPGGLEAMSILAFTLAIDPVYVATHHIARFLLFGVSLPVFVRFRPDRPGETADDDQRWTGTS